MIMAGDISTYYTQGEVSLLARQAISAITSWLCRK
jgi:hypothetical protein